MNNNLLTERAILDVFETTGYISFGTDDVPLEYGIKPPIRSAHSGKQMLTAPGKPGKTIEVYFQKEHPWISDGDLYVDRTKYAELQDQRYKGFLDSDFSRRDEFSNTIRTEQYREMLKLEDKHTKRTLQSIPEADLALAAEPPHRTRFDGPKYLYDIGKPGLAVTPHCTRCHHETYYCNHRAAYSTSNPDIEKDMGGYRTASNEIGRTAKAYNYAKPAHARKPIIRDTFYRSQKIFFPSKTKTGFVNQAQLN